MSVPADFGGAGAEQSISRPRPDVPEDVLVGVSSSSPGVLPPKRAEIGGSKKSQDYPEQSGNVFEEEDSLGMLSEATSAVQAGAGSVSGTLLSGTPYSRQSSRGVHPIISKLVIGAFLVVMLGGLVFVLYLAMTIDPNTWATGTNTAVKAPRQKVDVAHAKTEVAGSEEGVESKAKDVPGDMGEVPDDTEEVASLSDHFEGFVLGAKETTVIAIDASGLSKAWLGAMKEFVTESIQRGPVDTPVQVIFWTDYGAKSYPNKPAVMDGQKKEELGMFMRKMVAISVADPMPAVKLSLRSQPGRLIMVTGQALSEEQIKAIKDKVGEDSRTRIDIVLVDVAIPELKKWVEGQGGSYTSVSAAAVTGRNGVVDPQGWPAIEPAADGSPSVEP